MPTVLNALTGDPDTAFDGEFWRVRSPLETDGAITVPTFVVGGQHDLFQRSEPMSYERIKTQAPAKLLMGPWTHLQAALGEGLPADGVPPLNHIQLQWFDQHIRGLDVGADTLPNVTQYVLGHGRYVTAGEAANTVLQVSIEGLCSISTSQWTAGAAGFVPLPCFENSNASESWSVVYQTPPLAEDLNLNGPIEADIWMTTTAADAGLSVRVDDVDDGGVARSLTNGLQTASLRAVDPARSRTLDGQSIQPWHPYTQDSVQAPGDEPVRVPVEVFQTSALIAMSTNSRFSRATWPMSQDMLNGCLSSATA